MKRYIYNICIILLLIVSLTSCVEPHEHSVSDYFIDPTCTKEGYHIFETCCDGTKQIVIPALGHTYSEGICINCGEKDPNYVAPHIHEYIEGKCECGGKDAY